MNYNRLLAFVAWWLLKALHFKTFHITMSMQSRYVKRLIENPFFFLARVYENKQMFCFPRNALHDIRKSITNDTQNKPPYTMNA